MSDTQISLEAGMSRSWLAEIKFHDIEKYNEIKKLGVEVFRNRCNAIRDTLADIYWEIKETPGMSFADLQRAGDSDISQQAYTNYINMTAFNMSENTMQMKTFKRIESIIEDFKKYKETE